MENDNNNIDDLFFDFFKENINGKGNSADLVQPETNLSQNKNSSPQPIENSINSEEEFSVVLPPTFSSSSNEKTAQPKATPPSSAKIDYGFSKEEKADFQKRQKELMVRRSEEVHEILSYVPHWMIRWGITVLFLILGSILVMSYYIKYPDVVKGNITITSDNPPADVFARSEGAIMLFHKDKSQVEKDEVIALLKSNAKYDDIKNLKSDLENFKMGMEAGRFESIYENYQVGDLQNGYSSLSRALKAHQLSGFEKTNGIVRKQNIENQIRELNKIADKQKQTVKNLEREYKAGKNILTKRYLPLFKKGSISREQLEAKQSEIRNQSNNLQSAKVSLNETQNRVLDLTSQKSNLDFSSSTKMLNTENEVTQAYHNLVNDITRWEQQFLLKAPIAGKLNYLKFVKNNMFVQPNQQLASIIPSTNDSDSMNNQIVGELFIGSEGAGKVELGQVVNIEFSDFNKKEFGIVKGEVVSIADQSTSFNTADGPVVMYKIDVNFPEGLTTSLKKDIKFKYNMQGSSEIITNDVRLLHRIFSEIRAVFANE